MFCTLKGKTQRPSCKGYKHIIYTLDCSKTNKASSVCSEITFSVQDKVFMHFKLSLIICLLVSVVSHQ